MPRTKKADQDEIRKLRKQRKTEITRQKSENEILDHEEFGDIYSCVGEAILGLINNDRILSAKISESSVDYYIQTLNSYLLGPYKSGELNLSKVAKFGVEIWLHRKHHRKEMSLKEVGDFVGGLVNEKQVFKIDQNDFPWFPKHPMGELVWKSIFDLAGVINNGEIEVEKKIEILYNLRNPVGFRKFLIDLRLDGKYKIDSRFQINPGEALVLE